MKQKEIQKRKFAKEMEIKTYQDLVDRSLSQATKDESNHKIKKANEELKVIEQ
jgi:hypothetical protein